MRSRLASANVVVLCAAVTLRAFDAAYAAVRSVAAGSPDALLYYNMILTWSRHGDSPRGFTLTPSPYFIDLLLQLPLALAAPDFERFAYALALLYALLLFAALALVLRAVGATTL